jgi:dTDP-4-dehydrorhamnose 3,5-epimerase-like enzyme
MPPRPDINECPVYFDDRGSVYCALDNMVRDKVQRTYVVRNWRAGLIRAWHGHRAAWTGMHVIKGAAKLVARHMDEATDITSVVLSDKNPGVFWIPPGYYNGSMTLEDDTRILVYSTLTFDDVKSDDYRAELTESDRELFEVKDR